METKFKWKLNRTHQDYIEACIASGLKIYEVRSWLSYFDKISVGDIGQLGNLIIRIEEKQGPKSLVELVTDANWRQIIPAPPVDYADDVPELPEARGQAITALKKLLWSNKYALFKIEYIGKS
jgi:hypothetical protein